MDKSNDVLALLSSQKTTRSKDFSSRIITEDLIDAIKKAVVHTPNTSNRQIYSIITLNHDQLQLLGKVNSSHAFIFCVDFNRFHNCARILNRRFDSNYLTQFMSGIVDVSLLAQSAIIAAKSQGIDTLITNELYLENKFDLHDKLNIPAKHCVPILSLYMGYSEKKEARQKGRLPNQIVFHDGRYSDLSVSEYQQLISLYDDETNNLGLNESWGKMNYDHYLDWFFEKWCSVVGSRKNCEDYVKELVKREIL